MKYILAFSLTATLCLAVDPRATPPFKVDHKAPLKTAAKIVERAEGFTKYRVEFNGIEGDRVPGHLYIAKEIHGPVPAVLVQHGIGDK